MNTAYHTTLEHPRILFFLAFALYAIGIGCGIVSNYPLSIELALLFPLILALLGGWREWYIVVMLVCISLGGWYLGQRDYVSRSVSWEQLQQETSSFSGSYIITGRVDQIMYTSDLSTTYRLQIANIANRSTGQSGAISGGDIGIFFEIPSNLHIGINDTIEYTGKIMKVVDRPLK